MKAIAISLTVPVLVMLGGCNGLERARIVVRYGSVAAVDSTEVALDRLRVEQTLAAFSKESGFTCRPHIKRVEELTCRGPRDLHMTFRPVHNRAEFIAEFTWLDTGGRTPEEFADLVQRFSSAMAMTVGAENVITST